jgi:hypothetical protein
LVFTSCTTSGVNSANTTPHSATVPWTAASVAGRSGS